MKIQVEQKKINLRFFKKHKKYDGDFTNIFNLLRPNNVEKVNEELAKQIKDKGRKRLAQFKDGDASGRKTLVKFAHLGPRLKYRNN